MAALNGNLFRLSWGGSHFGKDQWSCGLHFESPVTTQPDVAAMAAAMETFRLVMGQFSTLDFWKYNQIDPNTGKYLGADSNTYELNPVLTGINVTGIPQATMVASLTTDVKRGPAHSGRVYLPTAATPAADGKIPAALAEQFRDDFRTFIQATVATKTHLPIVWSQTYKQRQTIRSVGVGRIVDTQRRRRKSLDEAMISRSIT